MIIDVMGVQNSKGVSTPTEGEKAWEEEANNKELGIERAATFRRVAARTNYLAADRLDLIYAVKEISRQMAKPTNEGWKQLKRLAMYLQSSPSTILEYSWQSRENEIVGFSDSD